MDCRRLWVFVAVAVATHYIALTHAAHSSARVHVELQELARRHGFSTSRHHRAANPASIGLADGSLQVKLPTVNPDNTVTVDIYAESTQHAETVAGQLREIGMVITGVFNNVISGHLPLTAIDRVEDIVGLTFCRSSEMVVHKGAFTSEGVKAMKADTVISGNTITGAGTRVAVLSNSYNTATGVRKASEDVASGDLPANVEILEEANGASTDEGRGMLQIVHDVAPGASLSFATALGGAAAFATNILRLAGCPAGSPASCKPATSVSQVIVDDILYVSNEPYFADGIIAQAVDIVTAAGVIYLSAAGNDGNNAWRGSAGTKSSTKWERNHFGAGTSFGGGFPIQTNGANNFYLALSLAAGDHTATLHWEEPVGSATGAAGDGAATDLDFYVLIDTNGDNQPDQIISQGSDNNLQNREPIEFASIVLASARTVYILIVDFHGNETGSIAITKNGGITSATPAFNAPTLYGHANAAGAIAVGAVAYFNTPDFGVSPPIAESFTALGGVEILFNTNNQRIEPVVRQQPVVSGPDGGITSFFGTKQSDGAMRFFGTSAASPHVAAVVALMRQVRPTLNTADAKKYLTATAIDMNSVGFDYRTGAGLVRADLAVTQATSQPPSAPAPPPQVGGGGVLVPPSAPSSPPSSVFTCSVTFTYPASPDRHDPSKALSVTALIGCVLPEGASFQWFAQAIQLVSASGATTRTITIPASVLATIDPTVNANIGLTKEQLRLDFVITTASGNVATSVVIGLKGTAPTTTGTVITSITPATLLFGQSFTIALNMANVQGATKYYVGFREVGQTAVTPLTGTFDVAQTSASVAVPIVAAHVTALVNGQPPANGQATIVVVFLSATNAETVVANASPSTIDTTAVQTTSRDTIAQNLATQGGPRAIQAAFIVAGSSNAAAIDAVVAAIVAVVSTSGARVLDDNAARAFLALADGGVPQASRVGLLNAITTLAGITSGDGALQRLQNLALAATRIANTLRPSSNCKVEVQAAPDTAFSSYLNTLEAIQKTYLVTLGEGVLTTDCTGTPSITTCKVYQELDIIELSEIAAVQGTQASTFNAGIRAFAGLSASVFGGATAIAVGYTSYDANLYDLASDFTPALVSKQGGLARVSVYAYPSGTLITLPSTVTASLVIPGLAATADTRCVYRTTPSATAWTRIDSRPAAGASICPIPAFTTTPMVQGAGSAPDPPTPPTPPSPPAIPTSPTRATTPSSVGGQPTPSSYSQSRSSPDGNGKGVGIGVGVGVGGAVLLIIIGIVVCMIVRSRGSSKGSVPNYNRPAMYPQAPGSQPAMYPSSGNTGYYAPPTTPSAGGGGVRYAV